MPPAPSDAAQVLERLRTEVDRERDLATRRAAPLAPAALRAPRHWRAARRVLRLAALVLLPFVLLVRVAVTAHATYGYPTWLALLVATAAAAGVVTAYVAWISKRLTGRARFAAMAKAVALPLVLAYTLYALLYVSAANAKSGAVRAEYLRLHPILRLGVGTLILADGDVIITDIARRLDDYAAMGLPAFERSRHLRQPDGYAHALDLRTIGRGELRNRLTQLYFAVMGFETLRHVGTADHLHVELRSTAAP